VDMSFPEGMSVNEEIRKSLSSLSHEGVQGLVRSIVRMGRGTLMAKVDVNSGYTYQDAGENWESAAYSLYIRTPQDVLCSVSGMLVNTSGKVLASNSSVRP